MWYETTYPFPKLQLLLCWSLEMDKQIYPTFLLGMWFYIHAGITLVNVSNGTPGDRRSYGIHRHGIKILCMVYVLDHREMDKLWSGKTCLWYRPNHFI